MELDTVLLDRGELAWRVYGWEGPWVSLGRFQRPERAVPNGWERWCSRPTGGRAVLHGHDLTLAFVRPLGGNDTRDLRSIYRRLVAPLAEALTACGLPARLAEGTRHVRKAEGEDCFAMASPLDLIDPFSGRKVGGCALRVTERAALLQASVPVRPPLVEPRTAIVGGVPVEFVEWNDRAFEESFGRVMASR